MQIEHGMEKNSVETTRSLRFWVVGLGAVGIGLVLILVAVMQTHDAAWVSHIVRDLGIAFLVAGIVGVGVDLYTRREGEEILRRILNPDSIRSMGVLQMFIDRLNLDFMSYIKDTVPGCEIRLLGISMTRLANPGAQAILLEKLRQNCKIKLLLLDPRAREEVRARAVAEGVKDLQQFEDDIFGWNFFHRAFLMGLPAQLRERMELRLYRTAPDYFIVDNDRKMLVGFYLRPHRGEEVPHIELEVKKGGAASPFRDHFDALWEMAEDASSFERRKAQVPVPKERRQGERRQEMKTVPRERRRRRSPEHPGVH